MAWLVYYHHPLDEHFSLRYSSGSVAEVGALQDDTDRRTKLIGYPFDQPVYVLYASDMEPQAASDIDFDREWLSERLDELPRSAQVTAFRLVELLEAAVDVREGDEFRLYKSFEPAKIQQALDKVSWGTELNRVAGGLMSNLILSHSLPNANHRTGIAMLQFCIESVDSSFGMPSTHVDDDTWREWVDPYIIESKRLITVRRNNLRFRRLAALDVDLVELKNGIQIPLDDFELDMSWQDAHSIYATRHETHCIGFARAVMDQAGRRDLIQRSGPTKSAFIAYLETGLVERDFRELF